MSEQDSLSILVVEDNYLSLEICRKILKSHHVDFATDANEGIEKFKEINPDITFLDINLPDRNGYIVLEHIKKINPAAFVIMLTGSRLKEDVIKSYDEGAKGYIVKPFSAQRLNETIEQYKEYCKGA